MPKKQKNRVGKKPQDSIQKAISAIKTNPSGTLLAVIIVVVLAFLLANYFTNPQSQPETKPQEGQQQLTLPTVHTVQKNETLGTISQKYYGKPDFWKVIADTNKLALPNIIHPGNKLTIPKLETQPTSSQKSELDQEKEGVELEGIVSSEEVIPKQETSRQTYKIQKGDNLWKIAEKFYNDGFAWRKIYDANPGIGRLPNGSILIHTDNTLIIPK